MIDKIVIVNNNQAYIIFTDREPVGIASDTCVRTFLMWFLGAPSVVLKVDYNGTVTGFEIRKFDDEITMKINVDEEAA